MNNRQEPTMQRMTPEKFDQIYQSMKDIIYTSFDNDLPATGYENYGMKNLLSNIQNYNGDSFYGQNLTRSLTELYFRLKKDKTYTCDKIAFVDTKDADCFGLHSWANQDSKKMSINIYNPQGIFERLINCDKVFNKKNLGMCILSSMIHETQHDIQSSNLLKSFKGEKVEPYERVNNINYLASTSGLTEMPYGSTYVEVEANYVAASTIFDLFKKGDLRGDYNSKLLLYTDIVTLLHVPKEIVIEDNTKYFNNIVDIFSKSSNKDVKKLTEILEPGDLDKYKEHISDMFDNLNKMRRELELDLIKNVSPSMVKAAEKLKNTDEFFKKLDQDAVDKVIKDGSFNESRCCNFKKYLSSCYYEAYISDNKFLYYKKAEGLAK